MKIEIKNFLTGGVIFEHAADENSTVITLETAVINGVNLLDANLRGANLSGAKNLTFPILPEEGAFIGWKKLSNGVVVKLEIPTGAKRT